jgi:hypothetical protein
LPEQGQRELARPPAGVQDALRSAQETVEQRYFLVMEVAPEFTAKAIVVVLLGSVGLAEQRP